MTARSREGKQREGRNGVIQEAEMTEVGARKGDGVEDVIGGDGGGEGRVAETQRGEIGVIGEERGERRKDKGITEAE